MHKVLLTADFEESYMINVASNFSNITVEQIPFIKTSIKKAEDDTREALNDNSFDCWIFTSKNAVKSLQSYPSYSKPKYIACVGSKTRALLEELDFDISFYSENGSLELAKDLAASKQLKKALFLAGDQHLSVINNKLSAAGKTLVTCIVYENKACNVDIQLDTYDGILFCSPSAVLSFHQKYKVNHIQKPLFAIGNTTAESIRKLGVENVLLASEANLHSLIKKASEHFKNQ